MVKISSLATFLLWSLLTIQTFVSRDNKLPDYVSFTFIWRHLCVCLEQADKRWGNRIQLQIWATVSLCDLEKKKTREVANSPCLPSIVPHYLPLSNGKAKHLVGSRRERRFYYEMLIFFLFIICRCNDITGKFEYFLQSGSKKVVHLCRPLKIEPGNFMWTECAPANVGSQISLCSCWVSAVIAFSISPSLWKLVGLLT